jgi:hypothetical protein
VKEYERVVEIQMERLTFTTTYRVYTDESPTEAMLYIAVHQGHFDVEFLLNTNGTLFFSASAETTVFTVL